MASPTVTRATRELSPRHTDLDHPLPPAAPAAGATPSARTPRSPRRSRHQLRVQWLLLAAALTVLAGVLVAWALDRAADRVQVVTVARPVAAGSVIAAADLTVTSIAFDTPVTGLAPATSLPLLVGRIATVDLQPGVLLTAGMWADGTELSPDERTIGAVLEPGAHPAGLSAGASVQAVDLTDAAAAPVLARVLDADSDERGGLRVTLAVPAAEAARLARLAAIDQLALVGVPAAPAPEPDSPDTPDTPDTPAAAAEPAPPDAPAAPTATTGDQGAATDMHAVFDTGQVTP